MANSVVDLYIIYQFLKRLTTPFNEWPAFEQGIIDERGTLLKKRLQRKTQAELNAFSTFDLMILKLKRLLEKIPGGKTRLASYAAALFLVKEDWEHKTETRILTESNDTYIDYLRLYKLDTYARALEEMPTNSAGSGAIAGMGVNGPNDVKVSKNKQKKYKEQNKIDAANYHDGIKTYVNRRFGAMF